ncbi:MAG: hypothetical protein R3318_00985 [Gammaproteobacteria bacterium]|nr:hypothetical protein [Gammaproteobacteria bacterium]
MKYLVVAIFLAILGLAAYIFLGDSPGDTGPAVSMDNRNTTRPADTGTSPDKALSETLKQEAQTYIREITRPEPAPVEADEANDFMTGDQVISLANKQNIQVVKPADLLDLEGLDKSSPITVITEQEQVENVSIAKILEEAGGDLDRKISVLENGKIRETSVEKLIAEHDRDEQIPVIRNVRQFEIRTPAEIIADDSIDKNKPLKIIKEPYRIETTTVSELLMDEDINSENVFYVRNVTENDDQGIWGIVHNGLIDNFATGIALRRGETIRKYRISIPRDADEMRDDATSSYLGRLIQKKTAESYVYNFKQGKMGRNPDLIYPGQEIIIIKFSADELINIYQHFVENVSS